MLRRIKTKPSSLFHGASDERDQRKTPRGRCPHQPACRSRPTSGPAASLAPSSHGVLLAAVAIAALVGAGDYGKYWWTSGRFLVSTDDAYLQADNVIISPKISGYIADVLVEDNQAVKAGQVLARIDDADYRTALAAARATVDADARPRSTTWSSRSPSSSWTSRWRAPPWTPTKPR